MPIERKSAAIMFTDIAGYTEAMSESEQKALDMLRRKRSILKPLIDNHQGTYVKEIGDGTLSYFESGYNASACAKEFQKEIYKDDLNIRIGIHIGDIVFDDEDVYGDGVNIASRIESLAPVGGVLISKNVYDELINKDDFDSIHLGLQSLKGVGRLVDVYAIKDDYLVVPKPQDYKETEIEVHKDDEVPSIAIVPFKNKGADEDVFYAYGISADLISDCSSAGLIRVSGLNDIEKLDYENLKYNELSKNLLVRYIATGMLWKMGDMFQLSIELYDTKDKKVVWSDRWQEKWDNLTMVQSNLSEGLLKTLNMKPQIERNIETTNPVAYEYYLKGRHKLLTPNNKEDRQVAIDLLNKAIALDDSLIDAKCALAHTQPTMEKVLDYIKSNIKEATALGNKNVLAKSYDSEGWTYWTLSQNELAMISFKKAIEIFKAINNKEGERISLNGLGWVNKFLGQSENAFNLIFESIKIAKEIEDRNGLFSIYSNLALFYVIEDKYTDAINALEKGNQYSDLANFKDSIAVNYFAKGRIDLWKGNFKSSAINFKASNENFELLNDKTNIVWTYASYIFACTMQGDIDVTDDLSFLHNRIAEGWLLDIDYPDTYFHLYKIYKNLNDSDKAQSYLDLSYRKIIKLSECIQETKYKKSYFEMYYRKKIISEWESYNKK